MFSHHGSAEQDAGGKWEQLASWEMKRDTVFYYLTEDLFHWLTHTWQSEGIWPHESPGVNTLNVHLRGLWATLTRNFQKVVYFSVDNVHKTSLKA